MNYPDQREVARKLQFLLAKGGREWRDELWSRVNNSLRDNPADDWRYDTETRLAVDEVAELASKLFRQPASRWESVAIDAIAPTTRSGIVRSIIDELHTELVEQLATDAGLNKLARERRRARQ